MVIKKFEDILAWRKAKTLGVCVYEKLKTCRDFSFRDQIQRAATSIMNNIAEGFERATQKEFKQFLHIAKGSSGEVRSLLHLGFAIGYLSQKDFEELFQLSTEISKMLSGFIKSL